MHIMSPAAGKMRLNTRSAGICSTNRKRPDRVSRLTRMLVPKPKNAFQSPGTQSFGLKPGGGGVVREVMAGTPVRVCGVLAFPGDCRLLVSCGVRRVGQE